MKNQKENLFFSKFRLLESQEHSEEISWSSSESSEFEEINKPNFNNITNKKPNRKRKRKNKVPNNLSNLDITMIDVNKDRNGEKSPVLPVKTKTKSSENMHNTTYSLGVSSKVKNRTVTSPVLCTGPTRSNSSVSSPVIAQKFASPVNSPKIRKALFSDNSSDCQAKAHRRNVSPVLSKHSEVVRRKNPQNDCEDVLESHGSTEIQKPQEYEEDKKEIFNVRSININVDLIKKVKSFFESHFNSENSSQHSIADTLTPKNSSSSDIDILSAITQNNPNESLKTMRDTNSTDNSTIEAEKSKKIKYKKDGLAHRLNALLKKHNANISIWQHERFLAENSNFKIPKGEHLVFRILKVSFNFGCFLLKTMDVNDKVFLILINNNYVNNSVFNVDCIFKLYEPYQIFEFDNNKLIVNVCKFECLKIEQL